MSRDRGNQHWRRLLIATVLAALSVGCGNPESERTPSLSGGGTGGNTADAAGGTAGSGANGEGGVGGVDGGAPFFDASVEGFDNNPIDQLFADPQRNPADFLGVDAQGSQGYIDAAVACYAEPNACDTHDCDAFASCCVASGSCCEPVVDASLPGSLDFRECDGLTVDSCTASEGFGADVFGTQSPVLTDRGVIPNGTATAEGGALIGDVVNLATEKVLVEVRFASPIGCNGTCLQSAGVAFTSYSALNEFEGAEVGLLLSGSREVVSLIIGGQVVDSFDADSDSTVWRVTLSPSGVVEVARDGIRQGRYLFDSASLSEARLAIFGRNLGDEADSAAVARLTTQIELCDNPRGWTERVPMAVSVQGQPDPKLTMGAEPSIADGPQYTAIAFELDGQIYVGQEEGFGQMALDTPDPIIFPTEPFEAGGVGDPELFWIGDSLYVLYGAYDSNGVGSIGLALVTGNMPQKGLDPILAPQGGVVSYDSPTVMVRDDLIILIARATLQSGATELRAYYSVDLDTGWARIVNGTLEQLTRVEDPTSEVTSPSLIVHNSAYHLYYARRTGTRWAIELATSDELLIWRPLGEALGASGEGFDSMGALGPDARSLTDRVEMVYVGQDGVSFQLGYASRPAPSDTAATIF